MPPRTREQRSGDTREAILDVAERLFAEHGVFAVSNRHISQAAGQGNNAAVGYHFGTKTDLVRAIVRRHAGPTEALRETMLARLGGSPGLRELIDCLVRPGAEHLAALPEPTWYGRFSAQVTTDPGLREIVLEETYSPSVQHIIDGLHRCLPDLPAPVRTQRGDMTRLLLTHSLAERERDLAAGTVSHAGWDRYATGLVDALGGLWTAPVTPVG
jgi:AcrR family transcriptional regulator